MKDGGTTPTIQFNTTAGNITASKNISASGIITAEHLLSSDDAVITDLLTVGRITSTGNSILGNTAGDTHTFTGDITASRHISASGTIYGLTGSFVGGM